MRRSTRIVFARLCRWIKRVTGIEQASAIRSHAMAQNREASRHLSAAADGALEAVNALVKDMEGRKLR